jgi:transcriptional regulator
MGDKVDLLQGTLEVLILKSVSLGALHGYGILLRIQQISQGRLEIPQGSFYIALYRMEHKGLVKGEWGESENNRRAKFYTLTVSGRKQLKAKTAKWTQMTDVVDTILGATPEEA